jgi:DUF177 domain-containing protein
MKIRLDQVHEPFVWQETVEVSSTELELPELVEISAVDCRGKISPMAGPPGGGPARVGFLLRAALSYQQKLTCMRCLRPVSVPVASELDLVLETGRHELPGQELELEEGDLGLLVLEDAILETRPIIVEQVQLNIPMKPLCKDDCAGLCADCGADLNAGPCGCEPVRDTRWQALAALKRSE